MDRPDYTNIDTALGMLFNQCSLRPETRGYGPSFNEQEAYKTILANQNHPEVIRSTFLHKPSMKILIKPCVGLGVTLHYPSDCYPYEVTRVISEQTLEIRAMDYTPVPGWKPDFHPGGFVGHISNLHDQKFTYTSNPNGRVSRIRLNKRGNWMDKTIPYSVGYCAYFRDWND